MQLIRLRAPRKGKVHLPLQHWTATREGVFRPIKTVCGRKLPYFRTNECVRATSIKSVRELCSDCFYPAVRGQIVCLAQLIQEET